MKEALTCAVHRHLMHVPVEIHHIWPKGMGGPDTPENKLPVCANGHSLIHEYMRLFAKGPVPWKVRRRYGSKVRQYAERGYRESQTHDR